MLRVLSLTLAVVALSACAAAASAQPARSEDLAHFAATVAAARARAAAVEPGAVLRQVDFDVGRDRRFFRFVDAAATREIVVADDDVTVTTHSKLVRRVEPDLDVAALRVGPKAAAAKAAAHWEACTPLLTLHGRTWYVFCETPAGLASATVDALDGTFRPSPAPPAPRPPTATPR